MIKDADYETMDGAKQVYIVDEAQRLSAAAQEAFLKAIESRLFIVILCTTDPQKVKGPIRSRLEEYPVYPPPTNDLVARLKEVCEAESMSYQEQALTLLSKVKENCPRECIIALDTISQLGEVDEPAVRSYFRFDSFEMISNMLAKLDNDPQQAFDILDQLSNKESPTWIKDHIIMAIASALRTGVGAKPTFMVATNFYDNRGRGWAIVASDLGAIDRINISDIEAILLKESRAISAVAVPEIRSVVKQESSEPLIAVSETMAPKVEAQTPEPPKALEVKPPETRPSPSPKPVATKKVTKEITVDGVNFNSDEVLTSLDSKVGKVQPPVSENQSPVLQVGLSVDHAPLTEKDFAQSLLARLRER